LRSRNHAWRMLLAKEWRALTGSCAWWVFLAAMGPLVGFAFISAVRTYAEASGLNGTALGVGEAFSPLIGVWAPTFSACELAAVFLLPFVVIRLVAGDRQSGAARLEAQQALGPLARVSVKALVLLAGWITASAAPAIAVGLWRSYGGSVHAPELGAVALGHVLNAALTIGLAIAAASIAEHPSTAAIVTLGITVGTWILTFAAAVNGGIWEQVAGYTPTALVAEFQHGLVRLDATLVALTLACAGVGCGGVWSRSGLAVRRRLLDIAGLAAATAAMVLAATFATASWDLSENRANSFPVADEAALRRITAPLRIEVHLAPEDPRRYDLDRRVLMKLHRVLPGTDVRYLSATGIGLFEQARADYGEVRYELDGRRAMSRATTPEAVLDTIYSLAGITPPSGQDAGEFRGHPLAAPPVGAPWVFYVIWPAGVVALGVFVQRRRQ
jgi:ABC-2 type transport system permease protein